jgi:predicted phosphodiesterase
MKLWVISDWHMEQRREFIPPRPNFDVLVVAGDVSNDIVESIDFTAAVADGKPSIFVAGNHEFWDYSTAEEALDAGREAASRCSITFLERSTADIDGVLFAGATLWEPDDRRHAESVASLARFGPDVVVTHFPPVGVLPIVGAALWIYGHHHGHTDRQIGRTRIVRNAIGYPNEPVDGTPIPDFVVEI